MDGFLDRGRDKGLSLAPPSEPDGRVSRIRLSSQWVRSFTMVRVHSCSAAKDNSPRWANHSFGQRCCAAPSPGRVRPRRFSNRLRSRRRTYPATVANVFAWLCWKYGYQPRKLRFSPATMRSQLRPSKREVCARIRSFNFIRLFFCGHFLPRPQEVEPAGLRRVDDPRLVRMQRQPRCAHPLPHRHQGGLRPGFTAAQDHEVVRVAHQFPSRRRHLVVERVEIHVGQQRTDHPALRRAPFGGLPPFRHCQHAGPEATFHQRQHPPVRHALFYQRQQPLVRYRAVSCRSNFSGRRPPPSRAPL